MVNSTRRALTLFLLYILIGGCNNSSPTAVLEQARQHLSRQEPKAAVVLLKGLIREESDNFAAQRLLGETYFQLGDFALAERSLKIALSSNNSDAELFTLYIQAQLQQKKHAAALDSLNSTKISTDTQGSAAALSAIALIGLGRIDAAAQALDQIADGDRQQHLVLYAKSLLHAANGDNLRAIDFARQAVNSAPNSPILHQHLGTLLVTRQLYEQAVSEFKTALLATGESRVTAQNLSIKLQILHSLLTAGDIEQAKTVLAELKLAAAEHPATQYFEGLVAYQENNFEKSENLATSVLGAIPNHAPAQLLAGLASYQQKKYELSNMYLERFLAAQPGHQPARKKLAATLLHLDKPKLAEAEFKKIASAHDGDDELQDIIISLEKSLSGGTSDQSALDELIRKLDAPTESPTNNTTIAIRRLLSNKEYTQAQSRLASLLKNSPENLAYLNLAGATAAQLGDLEQAEQFFRKALDLRPEALDATLNLGLLLSAIGKTEQAYTLYETLLAKKPKATQLLIELAKLADRLQRRQSALQWLQQAIDSDPEKVEPWQALINYRLRSEEFSESKQLAQRSLEFLPENSDLKQLLARAHSGLNEHAEGISIIEQLIRRGTDTGGLYLQRGRLQIAAGQQVEALKSFRQAFELAPLEYAAAGQLAALESLIGSPTEALKIADRYLINKPEDPRGYALKSNLLAKKGDLSAAATALGKAQSLAPTAAWTLLYVDSLIRSNQADQAFNHGENWLRDQPEAHGFRLQLANRYLLKGNYLKATQHFIRLADRDLADADTLNNLAWALYQSKNPAALQYAEQAVQANPGDINTTDTLAWILIDSRDDPRRGTELLRTLTDDPATLPPLVQYHLAAGLSRVNQAPQALAILNRITADTSQFDEKPDATALLMSLKNSERP